MYTIERIENVNIIFFNWTSDSYTLHYIHKIGKYLIKDGELVYYELYFNPLTNLKQLYTPYEKKLRKDNFRVE